MKHNTTNLTFGPYTPIRQAGELYFVSGQVGVDPVAKTASTDMARQTRQALSNLKRVLESAGLTLNDVIKTTLYVTDMSQFTAVNEVYQEFFDAPRPARSTVGVHELPHIAGNTPVTFEIEAIALNARA